MNPLDKSMTIEDIVSQVQSGMTLGIGGWGGRRKPMAFIRALLNAEVRDLTLVSYGGPDVGMLAAAGKLKKLIFGFVSMDSIPLEGHYRRARQEGSLALMELDEGMLQLGLKAAAARLPFLPTRVGLASDVLKVNPAIKTIQSPYDDGEALVAMPALPLDLAVCHVNEADLQGNSRIAAPDPFFDAWFCRAATKAYLSTERLVDTEAFNDPLTALQMPIERVLVHGVALATCGAHPTSCGPEYGMDLAHMRTYNAAAKTGWQEYRADYVQGQTLATYINKVGGEAAIKKLPLPVF